MGGASGGVESPLWVLCLQQAPSYRDTAADPIFLEARPLRTGVCPVPSATFAEVKIPDGGPHRLPSPGVQGGTEKGHLGCIFEFQAHLGLDTLYRWECDILCCFATAKPEGHAAGCRVVTWSSPQPPLPTVSQYLVYSIAGDNRSFPDRRPVRSVSPFLVCHS